MKVRDAIATWWMTNAKIRHGHPPEDPVKVTVDDRAPAAKSSWPTVVGAALLGSGLPLAGVVVNDWLKGDAVPDSAPAITAPSEPGNGSLYQFLEDNNLHLPENE